MASAARKYPAIFWFALINPISVCCDAADNIKCNASACTSPAFDGGFDCIVWEGDKEEPITCDSDSKFQYPRIVPPVRGKINYMCCNISDGSVNDYEDSDRQCDKSAASSFGENTSKNFVLIGITARHEPITCEDESFKYPRLLYYFKNTITYTCCKTSDSSFSDEGLPLSLGGYIRNSDFYISTISLLGISIVSALLLAVLMASIFASPETQSDSFNMYIVFLAIPDWILNMCFLVTNSMILADVVYAYSHMISNMFVTEACLIANIGINTIVGYEVKKMVLRSHQRIGTNPPTIKRILAQCLTTYFLSFLFAIFYTVVMVRITTPVFIWIWMIIKAIPFGYLLYLSWMIRRTGILSLTGRTRSLSVYFFRIIMVYVLFLLPGSVMLVANNTWYNAEGHDLHAWYAGKVHPSGLLPCYVLLSSQGAVTAVVAMVCKEDIWVSVKKTFRFRSFRQFQKNRWLLHVEKDKNWRLANAPPHILQEKDIIKAGMENNPSEENLRFAIKQTGWALQYAPEDLKSNFEIVLQAVTKCGSALQHASLDLRCNDEIVATAVRQMPSALQFALGGKNQSNAFLRTAGIFDSIKDYNPDKPKLVLSTRFSLGESTSATATIFALLMKEHPYFKEDFNVYFPNAYDKNTCDPEWTNIEHECRGTFETCQMEDELKIGVPKEHECCWRYSYRYQLKKAVAMVQVIQYYYADDYEQRDTSSKEEKVARHIVGNGQSIETQMASSEGRKVFRCFQPVNEDGNREEFDAGIMEDIAKVIERWYEEDPNNLEECNLRWKHMLGTWWLQKQNPSANEMREGDDIEAITDGESAPKLEYQD